LDGLEESRVSALRFISRNTRRPEPGFFSAVQFSSFSESISLFRAGRGAIFRLKPEGAADLAAPVRPPDAGLYAGAPGLAALRGHARRALDNGDLFDNHNPLGY